MGRAFPRLCHALTLIDATSEQLMPTAMADFNGTVRMFQGVKTVEDLELQARDAVIAFGGAAALALPPLTADAMLVHGSLSYAHRIGAAIRQARSSHAVSPVEALLNQSGGRRLFDGNVCDVQRGAAQDFTHGHVLLRASEQTGDAPPFKIVFQNENLAAFDESGAVLAAVPDLIVLVERDSARPVFVDEIAYGQRLTVLMLPCDKAYQTGKAAQAVSPNAFGLDIPKTKASE